MLYREKNYHSEFYTFSLVWHALAKQMCKVITDSFNRGHARVHCLDLHDVMSSMRIHVHDVMSSMSIHVHDVMSSMSIHVHDVMSSMSIHVHDVMSSIRIHVHE